MYSKLGITEHEIKEDVYDNVADSTIVGSPPVSSCCSLVNIREQGPVHVKGQLKNHLGFWQDVQVISPLGVVRKCSKKKLILDLRYVNKYLRIPKFKYEDIRTVREIFSLVIGFSSLTINQGITTWTYFHPTKSFLVSTGQYKGKKSVFSFWFSHLVWCPPPLVFTKIQKALVKHWCEQGIRIFTYLDDGAGVGKNYSTASTASSIVKWEIAASGFIAHPEKCYWEPTQVGDLLGFTLNLKVASKFPLNALPVYVNGLPLCPTVTPLHG